MRPDGNIAEAYMALSEEIRGGSLCMYGDYFGRPLDNCHEPIRATQDGAKFCIEFDGGIRIDIWHPEGIHVEGRVYTIDRASKLRFTRVWPPGSTEEPRFRLYEMVDGKLETTTNDDGCRPGRRDFPALAVV